MLRVYRYRLYPTRGQDATLRRTLWMLRELYNAALQERRDAYRLRGVTLSAYGQMAELREVRALRPEFADALPYLTREAVETDPSLEEMVGYGDIEAMRLSEVGR